MSVMHAHTIDNLRRLVSAAGAAGDQETARLAGEALLGDEQALVQVQAALDDDCPGGDACYPSVYPRSRPSQ